MSDENAANGNRFRVEQIDHVELFVLDRYAAAKWYERVLGLSICEDYEHWADDPGGPLMISSDHGSTKLALFEGEPQEGRETAGYHLVAFRVDAASFVRFLDRLESLHLTDHRGATVTRDDVADHGAARSIYFTDPHGHRLELTTYDVDALALLLNGRERGGGEADAPEIEVLDVGEDDAPAADGGGRGEPGEHPWLCHGCSLRISAEDGLVCSVCYRSTCEHCIAAGSREEPVCKNCVEERAG